ncbi:uncharacterized protein LOC106780037 [Vigna radiata var. radiata]|uniref:Uncharacterized protein LOC106780037 n=1 Tax=Vigna radiata var. radiata TaxID=3916 RepID=A0A1S3VZE7_VIGRR|nr:uncharacterized protein LOC106780037 [Vigna radiata var. radiata]
MVTTRGMENPDPIQMIKDLQAQLEEQARTIATLQQELQQKKTDDAERSKEKQHDREASEDSQNHNPPPPPRSLDFLPFTDAIMRAPMPDRPPPHVEKFDGTTNPEYRLRNFVDSMAFYTQSDPVKCRAFSLSLRGEALEWYYTLPPNSVDNFRMLTNMFTKQYSTNRHEEVTAAELVNLRQGKDETLRAFMHRYNQAARRIKGASPEFIIGSLPNCLKPGFVSESLYAKLPHTLEELQQKMAKFIKMEDQRISRKQQHEEHSASINKREGKRKNDSVREQKPVPNLNPRYDRYAHLTAPREKICRFHNSGGHTTEGCQTLKDEIQKLICAGHLREFVKEDSGRVGHSPRKTRRSPEHAKRKSNYSRDRSRSPPSHKSRSRPREREPIIKGRIDTISGGFAGGGASTSARKRHLRNLHSIHSVIRTPVSMPDITFKNKDFHAPDPDQDDPMVITARIAQYDVSKVLVDQGSSVNILYWTTFRRMEISEDMIAPFNKQIVGFAGERVDTRGYIDLRTHLGSEDRGKELRVRFLLVEANTSYNALLGRPCLNAFRVIVSTPHLAMKFPTDKGNICTVRADQRTARQCYVAGLKVTPYRKENRTEAILIDLDPRTNTDERIQSEGEIRPFVVGKTKQQTTSTAANLQPSDKNALKELLKDNNDLFA